MLFMISFNHAILYALVNLCLMSLLLGFNQPIAQCYSGAIDPSFALAGCKTCAKEGKV